MNGSFLGFGGLTAPNIIKNFLFDAPPCRRGASLQIVLESHHSPPIKGFIPIPLYQGGRQGGVMLYIWCLVPEIGITDFRDSHTDHTDTPQLCCGVVHSTCNLKFDKSFAINLEKS